MAGVVAHLRSALGRGFRACGGRSQAVLPVCVRNLSGKRYLNPGDEFVERPRWKTLFYRTLFIQEGQFVRNRIVLQRFVMIYVSTLMMTGYFCIWLRYHFKYPEIQREKQVALDKYAEEEKAELEALSRKQK